MYQLEYYCYNILQNPIYKNDVENVSNENLQWEKLSGKTLLLTLTGSESKLDPQFDLTPAGVTLPAYAGQATVTASFLGDGVCNAIDTINPKGFNVVKKDANTFCITGSNYGSHNLGFWLENTATYYGASKNVNVTVTEPITPPVLLHFADSEDLFANSGSGGTILHSYPDDRTDFAQYNSSGKFEGDGCMYVPNYSFSFYPENELLTIGYNDFSFESWVKYPTSTLTWNSELSYLKIAAGSKGYGLTYHYGTYSKRYYWLVEKFTNLSAEKPEGQKLSAGKLTDYYWDLTDWTHIAISYEKATNTFRFFKDGILTQTDTMELDEGLFKVFVYKGSYDEMRLLPNICAWKSDFTPPTEPY